MTNDARLWLYPGANPGSDATSWEPSYVDISSYVRRPGQDGGAVISYSGGRQDESSQTDAGEMTLTLDNRDGRFSTDKIDGPYYGLLDTNTPIRLAVLAAADSFSRVTASGWGAPNTTLGHVWSANAAWSTNGTSGQVLISTSNTVMLATLANAGGRDVDVSATITPLALATGASYGAGPYIRRATTGVNLVASSVEFNTAGDVTLKLRSYVNSVGTDIAASNPIPSSSYTANVPWKIRVQGDGDTIRAKAWPAASTEPTSWMITASETINQGTDVGIFTARFSSNTNTGVAALMNVDDFSVLSIEFTGFVVSWPLAWDITASNSWAPITAAGVLRRLRQGTNPVQSPLRRQLASTPDATGYWPMEEGSAATYFLNTVAGVNAARFTGVKPAQDNSLPGGGPAPTITTADGNIIGQIRVGQGGTGFAAMFLVKLPSVPATKTRIARIRMNGGPIAVWDLSIDTTGTYVEGLTGSASGFTVATSVSNSVAEDWTQWIAWQLETDNTLTPGVTTASAIYHQVGKTTYWAQSCTIAGTTLSKVFSAQLSGPIGTAFGHLWLGRNTLPFVTDTFSLVSSGYAGETAIQRFGRVCTEAGIPYTIKGGTSQTSERMGAQTESTTLAILQSAVDADYGVVAERGAGLEFIPRAARYNVTQQAALLLSSGHIGDVPRPVRDDQRLRNKWTVSRINGGSSTFQNDTSVARNGPWEDSATLNTFDDSVLEAHAGWRVAIGTGSRLRWPNITLNFARAPDLKASWRKRSYGWRLGITTGLAQVKGNEPDLIMEGFQAQLDPDLWIVNLNCTDAKIWTAAVADDTGIYGRIDNDQCTTTSTLAASTTGAVLAVTTATNYPKWDTTAALWSSGVDLNVGGERVTVTSVANGVGQAQTFTITARGVNGYSFSHPSGTSVSLWYPAPVAL